MSSKAAATASETVAEISTLPEAIEVLEGFPSGDIADAITVFSHDGGLRDSDRAAIEEIRVAVNAERREGVGETSRPIFSEDGNQAEKTEELMGAVGRLLRRG